MPATLALIKTRYEGVRGGGGQLLGHRLVGGSGLCSFVGGAIATGLGWRWIFVFSIAVALLALFCCAARRRAAAPAPASISWTSAVC